MKKTLPKKQHQQKHTTKTYEQLGKTENIKISSSRLNVALLTTLTVCINVRNNKIASIYYTLFDNVIYFTAESIRHT